MSQSSFSPEVQEILDRVRSGLPAPKKTRSRKKSSPTGLKRGENPTVARPAQYDREEIKRLHAEGLGVQAIADRLGAHRGTIGRALTALGITERRYGRIAQDKCRNGHDMAVWGRPVTRGGRYCRKCKTDRERQARSQK